MRLLIIFLVLLMAGCASENKHHVATALDGKKLDKLTITAEVNRNLSSEYFGMIEFSFQNESNKWIEIEDVKIDFAYPEVNRSAKIINGNEFVIWANAITKKRTIEQYNRALAYSAIDLFTNASLKSVDDDSDKAKSLYDSARFINQLSYSVSELQNLRSEVSGSKLYPEYHLLNSPIKVPPGLFSEAWLLVNTTDHEQNRFVAKIYLEITTKDGDKGLYEVPLAKTLAEMEGLRWQSLALKSEMLRIREQW